MDLAFLPALNASLNAVAASLLLAGRVLIKRGHEDAHRRVMLTAFAVSALFLVSYVAHKASRGFENTPFEGTGAIRVVYLVILATHVVLAMTVPFLAIALIRYGRLDRRASHRRLARIAWPIWLYVSATGVVVYFMLYHLDFVTVSAFPSLDAVVAAGLIPTALSGEARPRFTAPGGGLCARSTRPIRPRRARRKRC